MDDKGLGRGGGEVSQPTNDLSLIRMGRQGGKFPDLGAHLNVLAINLDLRKSISEQTAPRGRSLVTYEENRIALAGQPAHEVG